MTKYPLHHETPVVLNAPAEAVFAYLDDFHKLSAHMEVVTEREPPRRKAWQTTGAKLLVIGPYRLGFELAPEGARTRARVFIDYALPDGALTRWLGRLLGGIYARWCTERMAKDALAHFARPA